MLQVSQFLSGFILFSESAELSTLILLKAQRFSGTLCKWDPNPKENGHLSWQSMRPLSKPTAGFPPSPAAPPPHSTKLRRRGEDFRLKACKALSEATTVAGLASQSSGLKKRWFVCPEATAQNLGRNDSDYPGVGVFLSPCWGDWLYRGNGLLLRWLRDHQGHFWVLGPNTHL